LVGVANIEVVAQLQVHSAALPVHRLDAEQYGQVVASGALEGQRVELIDGIVVEMSPQSTQHAGVIERLTAHLATATARLRVQLPLGVAPDSVPEPDFALVEGPISIARHPTTALLVIEVSWCSQTIDRGRKAELYAAAGVPLYWVVDLDARVVEVRSDPGPSGYRTLHTLQPGDKLPSPLEGVDELEVAALLEGV
jgi:Uma2 family endonuclease